MKKLKVNDEKKASYKEDILKNIFTGYGESNIILENILLFKSMQYIMMSILEKYLLIILELKIRFFKQRYKVIELKD